MAPTHMFRERFYAHQMFPTPPRDSCNRVYREKFFGSVHGRRAVLVLSKILNFLNIYFARSILFWDFSLLLAHPFGFKFWSSIPFADFISLGFLCFVSAIWFLRNYRACNSFAIKMRLSSDSRVRPRKMSRRLWECLIDHLSEPSPSLVPPRMRSRCRFAFIVFHLCTIVKCLMRVNQSERHRIEVSATPIKKSSDEIRESALEFDRI